MEPNGRKAKSRPRGVNGRRPRGIARPTPVYSLLGRGGVAPGPENVADRRREIIQSCARHDDCVPSAMSFLGYPQEFSTLVLAEFEVKPLPFDLNFLRFENAVHLKTYLSLTNSFEELEAKSARFHNRKLFGWSGF